MARYIDALEIRYTYRPVGGDIAYKDEIEALPTADVALVIHAHWTCVNTNENVYMCDGKDGCGNCIILLEGKPKENDMLFCALCGARMDEEVKENG